MPQTAFNFARPSNGDYIRAKRWTHRVCHQLRLALHILGFADSDLRLVRSLDGITALAFDHDSPAPSLSIAVMPATASRPASLRAIWQDQATSTVVWINLLRDPRQLGEALRQRLSAVN
jgi:hypothetical protein